MAIKYYAGSKLTGVSGDTKPTTLPTGSTFLETNTDDLYFWDGDSWNVVASNTVAQTLSNKTLTSPVLNTGLSGTAFLDEDAFDSDSATKVASQQSIKAYIATQVSGSQNVFSTVAVSGQDNVVADATTDTLTLVAGSNMTITTTAGSDSITFAAAGSGTVTITDNESTAENNLIAFVADAATSTGAHGLEMDGDLYYNPSTGTLTSTVFVGALTGNASGTAATVTGASQTAITSVGTLTALQVDNLNINGNTVSSTGGTDLLITPLAGQQIVLDGTIIIDAGVVTGATSITSTAFVGTIDGVVGGNTPAAITGTTIDATTDFTIGSLVITDDSIVMTPTASDTVTLSAATNGAFSLVTVDNDAAAANIQITADGTAELAGTTVTLDSGGGITLDADNGTITFADGGASLGTITSSGYSGTAALATTVTISDNESTNENNAIIFTAGGDLDGGNLGLESDGDLHYNPSTGTVTATTFVGALTGNATSSTLATTVTVTDNESTNENNALVFVADADLDGGNVGLESDGDFYYNPSTGTLTATTFAGAFSGTATTATEATNITAVANNSTDETVYPTFVDGATGTQGIETDTGLTYNPSSGILTSTTFTGALSGNSTTATALATARTIGGTSFDGSAAIVPATITVADTTDTTAFVALFESATGDLAPKTDAGVTYNAGTGMLTATGFTGPLTGNASGTAATVTGGTQSAITSAANLVTVGTIGTGVWNGTAIITTYGGTGLASYTAGDIFYYASGTTLTKLAKGNAAEVLTMNSGATAPEWATTSSGASESFAIAMAVAL